MTNKIGGQIPSIFCFMITNLDEGLRVELKSDTYLHFFDNRISLKQTEINKYTEFWTDVLSYITNKGPNFIIGFLCTRALDSRIMLTIKKKSFYLQQLYNLS